MAYGFVSTVARSLPCRCLLKRLEANTITKHHFSIWAYWRSTEVNDRDVNATGCPSCSIYLTTSTIWCRTHNRAWLQFKCVLTDNPPSPGEADHTSGVYVPYYFRTVVWVLLRPTRTNQWKCCKTGPTVFRPYLRILESLTVYRCHCKDGTFSSVILRPWVLVRPGFEPKTSRSADRRSPNWANQAAVTREQSCSQTGLLGVTLDSGFTGHIIIL